MSEKISLDSSEFIKVYIEKSLLAFLLANRLCTYKSNLLITQIYCPILRFLLPKFHLSKYPCKDQSHQEY